MMDENTSSSQNPKDSKKPLLIIVLVFIVMVITVFLTQKKDQIAWLKDYEEGVELARKTNKPLLLVFYKPHAPMFVGAQNTTYNNPEVKKYVEANFVPILINVIDRPDLAKKFEIDYYPTHYVKHPDSDELFGPRLGGDMPKLFIEKMQELLDEMNAKIKE